MFLLVTGTALAVPDGYIAGSITVADPPGTESVVFAFDSNGSLYFGHSSAAKRMVDVRTERGASSEIWKFDQAAATQTMFYDSPAVNPGDPGMNSITGIAIDETTNPWTYYIADQEPVKGSPWTTGAVWRARDVNGNGTLDFGTDLVERFTLDINVLIYISDIVWDEASGDLFVTNSEGTGGNPMVYRLHDADLSGFIESDEMTPYANLPADYLFAGGLCFGSSNDTIFTHDTSGTIYLLEDLNSDGDALDSGEMTTFASLPVDGGYHIAMDPEGDLFVSASDWNTMTHGLYRITTGSIPEVSLFHDLTSTVGSVGKFVFSSDDPFEPGSSDVSTMFLNFTTTEWEDPAEFLTFRPESTVIETPSNSIWGLILLTVLMGTLLAKHN